MVEKIVWRLTLEVDVYFAANCSASILSVNSSRVSLALMLFGGRKL